ncbi:hypothetical protein Pfo_008820 [Paulownia fortunei]|nr:hypothetical protein Pfo_008820 [Paulownia fortunei]
MTPKVQHPITPAAPAPAPAPDGGGFRWWNSPIPFIIGGVALMLGVIPVALILLAFSYSKSSESSNGKSGNPVHDIQPEMEPRVVVIMAGETNPTHLAKPIAAINGRSEEV